MISMSTRTVTTKRHEYLLPRPATQSDLGKCLSNASHDMKAAGQDPTYDDAIMIGGDDENIIVYWVETTTE